MRPGPALVSIHDVTPATLDRVQELLELAAGAGIHRTTLLVVPGLDWSDDSIARVRVWAEAGHELAGHGWCHRARAITGLRHRLHSLLLSRDCAEHLALSPAEIVALMARCRAWFAVHGLPAPDLYVPPAWALGPVGSRELRDTGFRQVETLAGVRDVRTGRFRCVPLLGFEARDRWQIPTLIASNAANALLAGSGWRRVAIHPEDHRLPLRAALLRTLGESAACRSYIDFAGDAA